MSQPLLAAPDPTETEILLSADREAMILLTAKEVAKRLKVKPSWIIEQLRARTRRRTRHPLPVHRLGKMPRFVWEEVEAWLLEKDRIRK